MSNLKAPKYTDEQKLWLKAVPLLTYDADGKTRQEQVAREFNAKFGTTRSGNALAQKNRELLGVKKWTRTPNKKKASPKPQPQAVTKSKFTNYTTEMDKFLTELATDVTLSWAKRLKAFNAKFGIRIRKGSLAAHWRYLKRRTSKIAGVAMAKVLDEAKLAPRPKAEAPKVPSHKFRVLINGEPVWYGDVKPNVEVLAAVERF